MRTKIVLLGIVCLSVAVILVATLTPLLGNPVWWIIAALFALGISLLKLESRASDELR